MHEVRARGERPTLAVHLQARYSAGSDLLGCWRLIWTDFSEERLEVPARDRVVPEAESRSETALEQLQVRYCLTCSK